MTPRHEQPTPGPALGIAARFQALVPVIATERLVLRAPALADFPAYAEIVCGPRGRHIGGPLSRDDAWSDFAGMCANWMLHGHGVWTVENRDGGLLGFVLLGLEPGDLDVELGFLFLEAAEGRGFAFEAASAVRDWAFETLERDTLESYVDAANARSLALAERLGARDETPADWAGSGARLFRHRKQEVEQ